MSLTDTDLQAIHGLMRDAMHEDVPGLISTTIREDVPVLVRTVIREEVPPIASETILEEVPPMIRREMTLQLGPVHGRLADLDDRVIGVEGRLEAVENDIKDIYFMLRDLQLAVGVK